MQLKDINPFIRFSRLLLIREDSVFSECCPVDARLFFVENGEGKIKIDGTIFSMPQYSILFINSGQNYQLMPCNAVYNAINFDFTQNFSNYEEPIPPIDLSMSEDKRPFEQITFADAPCFDKYCFFCEMYSLRRHFQKIRDTYEKKLPFYRLDTSIELSVIILKIVQNLEMRRKGDGLNIEEVTEYIQNHFCEKLSNSELSQIFHFHPNYINAELKKYTGKSLHSYILGLRIEKSIALMESGCTNISEIADACGFSDANYFSRYFKKKNGISPRQAISLFNFT